MSRTLLRVSSCSRVQPRKVGEVDWHNDLDHRIHECPHGKALSVAPTNASLGGIARQRVMDFFRESRISCDALEQVPKRMKHFFPVNDSARISQVSAKPLRPSR